MDFIFYFFWYVKTREFRVYYFWIAAALLLIQFLRCRVKMGTLREEDLWRQVFADPYAIACLRGGTTGAIGVAVVSLIERGLLVMDACNQLLAVTRAGQGALDSLRSVRHLRPIDKAILRLYSMPGNVRALYEDLGIRNEAENIRASLRQRGLLQTMAISTYSVMGFLGTVAVIKLGIAFWQNDLDFQRRGPQWDLFAMAIISLVLLWTILRSLKKKDRRILTAIQNHFPPPDRQRILPPPREPDHVLTAAVWGEDALPDDLRVRLPVLRHEASLDRECPPQLWP